MAPIDFLMPSLSAAGGRDSHRWGQTRLNVQSADRRVTSTPIGIICSIDFVPLDRTSPARLRPHLPAALFGLPVVVLMLVWAVHDGGYDSETWYWGALATLGASAAAAITLAGGARRPSRASLICLSLFALYVAWSYLSITWAQSPGDALQGSNRALLYLLVFALLLLLPWTPQVATVALLTFVIGVGVIGIVLLFRLAAHDRVAALVIEGRLAAPTGYFNATSALFTMDALAAIMLATRRELPGIVRGLLLGFACSGLQLALIVQSRGWLFTLPVVAIVTVALASDRLRLALVSVIPVAGALVPIRRLLEVYQSPPGAALEHAAARAGHAALLACATVLLVGTLAAWSDRLIRPPSLSPIRRRMIGAALSAILVVALGAGFTGLTHGRPLQFISRQWNGFSRPQVASASTSHFGDVGSGRYDFWRTSLDAVLAHPIGGLGQDNFADYYVLHRRTGEETNATHSLEMRLLAHTGFVGLAVFLAFLIAALRLAVRARRRSEALVRGVAAAALMPLVVWLVHGSVDWFWEFPALSAPALGFLAVAGSLGATEARPAGAISATRRRRSRPLPRLVPMSAGILALTAGVVLLGIPYLSVREVSLASDARATNPAAALRELKTAGELNPLSSVPGRLAGAIALQNGQYAVAEQRFRQSVSREPGGWFAWLGAGLAASALGQRQRAHTYFVRADLINSRQPAIRQALVRVFTRTPLTSEEAFKLLSLVN